MNALVPIILNAEFGLLWSVRQLLRGIAIGIGLTSAMATLTLFAAASALGSLLDVLKERSHVTAFSLNSTNQTTLSRGLKEV